MLWSGGGVSSLIVNGGAKTAQVIKGFCGVNTQQITLVIEDAAGQTAGELTFVAAGAGIDLCINAVIGCR